MAKGQQAFGYAQLTVVGEVGAVASRVGGKRGGGAANTGLRKHARMPKDRLPVRRQPTQVRSQNLRGEIGPALSGQDQEAQVVGGVS